MGGDLAAFAARRRALAAAGGATALLAAGCAGVPLSTMAKLAAFRPETLLDADPAELRAALNADARLRPQTGQAPQLTVAIRPAESGTFPPLDRSIALHVDAGDAVRLGLAPARPGRQWLLYRLDAQGVAAVREVQELMRAARNAKPKPHRGSLTVNVRHEGVGGVAPELRDTRLETWLRVTTADGFVKLWEGRLADAGGRS